MSDVAALADTLRHEFFSQLERCQVENGEVTLEIAAASLLDVCTKLRDDPRFSCEQLIDLCGVDYLHYGHDEWRTHDATRTGYSRGVTEDAEVDVMQGKPRYAVVYHLLSLRHNHRIRLRCFAEGEPPRVDSVVDIWASADWFEREAFDLLGILFEGHPDLRRILTDYGFVGHPFRKDFPISGKVEARYDEQQGRVVYEPVSIPPRVLVPRVIRDDSRYEAQAEESKDA